MCVPRADVLADVSQVVQLSHVLRCGDITVGFNGRHQLPQTRCWRLYQPLAWTNHTPVPLWPIHVLVASRLLPILVIAEDVAEGVVGLGQCLGWMTRNCILISTPLPWYNIFPRLNKRGVIFHKICIIVSWQNFNSTIDNCGLNKSTSFYFIPLLTTHSFSLSTDLPSSQIHRHE